MASNHNFSHSTIHDINRWVRSFGFNTKTKFIAFKLEGIKALRNVQIKWDFLCAAVKFWHPEDHMFWFNTAELYPTIEEFSAILGYDLGKIFVVVSCDPRHKESLSDALDLPSSITDSIIDKLLTYGVTDNV